MKLSHFFIDHPRFAAVISIFIVVFGLAAVTFLPTAQYPNIVPPTITVQANYPGASAETVARTVATPLEQAINGVEGMDYISSQSTGNGQLAITVIFKIGTDPERRLESHAESSRRHAVTLAARGSIAGRASQENDPGAVIGHTRIFARRVAKPRIYVQLHVEDSR